MTQRKTSRKHTPKVSKAKWRGFINVSLSSTHKKAIKERIHSDVEALEFLENLVSDGYKVSLSCEPSSATYTVAVTAAYDNLPEAGYAFSMRHKDMLTAISAVSYVHDVMSDGGRWSQVGAITSEDDW